MPVQFFFFIVILWPSHPVLKQSGRFCQQQLPPSMYSRVYQWKPSGFTTTDLQHANYFFLHASNNCLCPPPFPLASRRCIRAAPVASASSWTRKSSPQGSPTRTTSTPSTDTASLPSTSTRAACGRCCCCCEPEGAAVLDCDKILEAKQQPWHDECGECLFLVKNTWGNGHVESEMSFV